MRILFLTHQYFPRHVGGTEMLVRGLASQMRSRGHEVAVLAYVETPGTELHDFGFRVSEFEGAPLWELHYNLACAANPAEAEFDNPFIAGLVAHAAGEIKPDVVHAMHLMKLSAAVLPRLKQMGIPVVATLCDFWPICLRHTLLLPEGDICQTGPDHPMRCLRCAQVTHGFAKTTNDESELALWQRAEAALADAAFPEPEFRCDVAAITTRTERIRSAFLMADRLLALTEFQRLLFVRHG
ncbi:MAG: glycosyltransferase, partial [Verrucomicrobia bacterium]|nr:glycosyltransferase [Verrucomicrobiota bacterium]